MELLILLGEIENMENQELSIIEQNNGKNTHTLPQLPNDIGLCIRISLNITQTMRQI